jgi:peptide/nickel transport system substrate-binding protein
MPGISRRFALRTGLAAIAAPAIGAGGARAQGADPRPALNIGVQSSLRSLEPMREFSNVSWRVGYNVFEGLLAVDYKDGLKLKPRLAESYRRVSPTMLEFTLKEGVRFHDGGLLTAEDVAFSFGPERFSGEKAPGGPIGRIFVGTIAHVEAVDPRTVRVATRTTDPLLEQRLAGWAGQIISKSAYLAAPSFEAWERAPVGTGPYKAKELRIDVRCVIEAHDAYHGGRPPAREIVFRVMPETGARIAALSTGEVDMVTELPMDQMTQVKLMAGREPVGGPILNFRVLVFDKNHPVLADARIRRALAVAIDRKAITDALYQGATRPTAAYQHPAFGPLYDATRPGTAYDPELARRLLHEAGYKGEPIPYRTHPGYYTLQLQTAQVLQEMWKAVGLNVQLEVKENWTQIFATEGRGIRDWSNSVLFQDPAGALSRLYGPRGPVQSGYKEWSNAAFNRDCDILETSLDVAERRAAFARMLDVYETADPPGAVLHDLVMLYGKKTSVVWHPYPVEYMDFGPGNLSFATA